jgi:hypothetical protein
LFTAEISKYDLYISVEVIGESANADTEKNRYISQRRFISSPFRYYYRFQFKHGGVGGWTKPLNN